MKAKDLKLFTGYYINLQENLNNEDKIQLLNFVKESSGEQIKSLLLTGQMRTLEEGEDEFVNEFFNTTPIGQILTELPSGDAILGVGKDVARTGVHKLARTLNVDGVKALKSLATQFADKKVPNIFKLGPLRMGGRETEIAWGVAYNKANAALHAGAALSAAAAVALIFVIAKRAYQSYLSKTAKACKGKKGDEKNECFRKVKAGAIEAQIQFLNQSKATCKGTSKPDKCESKVDQRIHKKKIALQKIMTKKKVR